MQAPSSVAHSVVIKVIASATTSTSGSRTSGASVDVVVGPVVADAHTATTAARVKIFNIILPVWGLKTCGLLCVNRKRVVEEENKKG